MKYYQYKVKNMKEEKQDIQKPEKKKFKIFIRSIFKKRDYGFGEDK